MPEAASGGRQSSPAARPAGFDPTSAPAELVARLTTRTWRLELELERERRSARQLDAELRSVYSSTSWRATRPLRMLAPIRASSTVHMRRAVKAVYWILTLQLRQQLRRRRAALALAERERAEAAGRTIAEWFRRYEELDEADVQAMRDMRRGLRTNPLVSIVMPVYNPPEPVLREAIESVLDQVYENWELCIADDASTEPHVSRLLQAFEQRDERIRVVRRRANGGISAASNDALAVARGEILCLLDHDDLLRPHSLLLAAREFENGTGVGFVYSDLVVVDQEREPIGHYFKPDWNPALLLSQNYLCHFSAMRMELVRDVGGFRSAFDGSQDWDLALRVTERLAPSGVVHVPHVLYLWRAISGSVAADGVDAKPYAVDAGRRAVEDHLRRIGATGYVVPVASHQSVRLVPGRPQPRVEVVIPSTGRRTLLQPCIEGVLSGTSYRELHVTVIVPEDAHARPSDRNLLREIDSDPRGRVITYASRSFNFARTVNEGFASCDAPLVLLLNDDTEILDPDWLDCMVGYALQERVGAVGSLLLYPDGSIQSAGMLVGRGVAEHLYHRRGPTVLGYSNRARLPQDLTAVAGTCMLVRREAFEDVGGWDESFPAAYNDVDFCLRLRAREWRVVYVPDAAVVHHESATFGQHQKGREHEHHADLAGLHERWGDRLRDDPMHNPNLELDACHPDRLAFPPRMSYSWRRGAARSARDEVTSFSTDRFVS